MPPITPLPGRPRTPMFVMVALLLIIPAACTGGAPPAPASAVLSEDAFLDELQERTFLFFWEQGNPDNGMVPDRWPTESFASIAAIGFGLTAYGVGVERGYISRDQAIGRTLATLRFLWNAPQGTETTGTAGHRGFFYHFLNMDDGLRFGQNELSTM
jgi:hypothetical protein